MSDVWECCIYLDLYADRLACWLALQYTIGVVSALAAVLHLLVLLCDYGRWRRLRPVELLESCRGDELLRMRREPRCWWPIELLVWRRGDELPQRRRELQRRPVELLEYLQDDGLRQREAKRLERWR